MSTKMRWGVIATGWVSNNFAKATKLLPEAELAAVGSRSRESAEAFGEKHGIPRRHGSYEDLVSDPDVEAVYIGTPHNLHHANTLMALEAGKHVLCEKPLAVNAGQAREMIEAARERGLFLMEAMWTRFVPVWVDLKERLDSGEFGKIGFLYSSFGEAMPYEPEGRAYNPHLAGGALLDLGVYPISLASWLLGKPETMTSKVKMADTGVDQRNAMIFTHPDGSVASLSTAMDVTTACESEIAAEKAFIRVKRHWFQAQSYEVVTPDGTDVVSRPFENGFQFEISHAMKRIGKGQTESEIMPLDESLEIGRTMDALRAEWGLKYPFE
jgi:predicted dehydrogenase